MMKNVLDFLKFEEENKEVNFKMVSEIADAIYNDLTEEERSMIKGIKIFNPIIKKLSDNISNTELSLLKNFVSTKLKKIDGEYFYIIDKLEIRFSSLFRMISWYDIVLSSKYISKNIKGGIMKEMKSFVLSLLIKNIKEIDTDESVFIKNHYDIRGGILKDETLNEELEESIKLFQPFFSYSFNNLIKEKDEFIIVNPSMPLSKFSERAFELRDRYQNEKKLIKFLIDKYYSIFNNGERCTIISPFKNISPDISIIQSAIRESIIIYDRSYRDEDVFFRLFKDTDTYEYYYDFVDKIVEYDVSIGVYNIKTYFVISKEDKDKMYFVRFNDKDHRLESDLLNSLSSLSAILEYVTSDSDKSELSYMVSDKKKELGKNKVNKNCNTNPHITYVRGFWRKSKYGVLHHVRPSKRFYGNPEYKDKVIRTLIVLK